MQRAGIESILGLRLDDDVLPLDPCIPRAWPRFECLPRGCCRHSRWSSGREKAFGWKMLDDGVTHHVLVPPTGHQYYCPERDAWLSTKLPADLCGASHHDYRVSYPIRKPPRFAGQIGGMAETDPQSLDTLHRSSSLSELICRKSGNHRRRVAFPGTTARDADQGFDFHA
jgi:hypothetical protein